MILYLDRYYHPQATIGRLTDDQGKGVCWTLECPWLDNTPFTSCVPEGTYAVRWVESKTYGMAWRLENVVGRTWNLIHPANKVTELQGCIATGLVLDGLRMVDSSKALQALDHVLGDRETWSLVIRQYRP